MFAYDRSYLADTSTPPLSLSMPKTKIEHGDNIAGRWIANLLPDSDRRLERLATAFGERRSDPFTLLAHIGHDVAGAVQIMPEGVDPTTDGGMRELTDIDLGEIIRRLRADADTVVDVFGRWSLAGQHGKIALTRARGAWYEPTGRHPSTHIAKVGISTLPHSDIAEFITLRAAGNLGIPAARVELAEFDGAQAIIVERYDRVIDDETGEIVRVHQEDLCQALGLPPTTKYQFEGGPSIRDIAEAAANLPLRARRSAAWRFAQLVTFNTVAFCPDAHAKNYSILLAGANAALAPAYDLLSQVLIESPVRDIEHKTQLAMKYGSSSYEARHVGPAQVVKVAEILEVDPAILLLETARQVAGLAPAFHAAIDSAAGYCDDAVLDGMHTRVEKILGERARRVFASAVEGYETLSVPSQQEGVTMAELLINTYARNPSPLPGRHAATS
jgi:serine/threonine-protein kinase HipA